MEERSIPDTTKCLWFNPRQQWDSNLACSSDFRFEKHTRQIISTDFGIEMDFGDGKQNAFDSICINRQIRIFLPQVICNLRNILTQGSQSAFVCKSISTMNRRAWALASSRSSTHSRRSDVIASSRRQNSCYVRFACAAMFPGWWMSARQGLHGTWPFSRRRNCDNPRLILDRSGV